MTDTIYALSSGAPPAAIAVIRISGPQAGVALRTLAGKLPQPRRATSTVLRDHSGERLDHVLALWLPGPGTATGEDVAELHCHGGRAVVAAVGAALDTVAGLRPAEPGEFTRRAFVNGRIDLAEAEGLADLLSAETELQRRNAISLADGALSRHVGGWREELLALSSLVEAELDFGDEDGVALTIADWRVRAQTLASDLRAWLTRPRAESLRDGVRVVLAGPPNTGKSSLFNALVGTDAAIVTPLAGTTRDVLKRSVALAGVPFIFTDTAGLREEAEVADVVEQIGITRARAAAMDGDIVLWLGTEGDGPVGAWEIEPRVDDPRLERKHGPCHRVSAFTGSGVGELVDDLVTASRKLLPKPDELALNDRQRTLIAAACESLDQAQGERDLLVVGENLREARGAFDRLLGNTGVEDMLNALFGRFCLGK